MVPEDGPLPVENREQKKKPYRKPCVQEYGSLREMTQTSKNPKVHGHDGGGTPAGKNRT